MSRSLKCSEGSPQMITISLIGLEIDKLPNLLTTP